MRALKYLVWLWPWSLYREMNKTQEEFRALSGYDEINHYWQRLWVTFLVYFIAFIVVTIAAFEVLGVVR